MEIAVFTYEIISSFDPLERSTASHARRSETLNRAAHNSKGMTADPFDSAVVFHTNSPAANAKS
ncbi:MAG TPA: hypothetical protein VFJ58_04125 [Armatimonadota bacterium]|nr:hypothetical protein [Armatimonadota bacterium]